MNIVPQLVLLVNGQPVIAAISGCIDYIPSQKTKHLKQSNKQLTKGHIGQQDGLCDPLLISHHIVNTLFVSYGFVCGWPIPKQDVVM